MIRLAWDDCTILGRESNHQLLEIKESLFSKRDQPLPNKNIYSQELFLFLVCNAYTSYHYNFSLKSYINQGNTLCQFKQ